MAFDLKTEARLRKLMYDAITGKGVHSVEDRGFIEKRNVELLSNCNALAAQNQVLRDSLVDTLYFLERNSNRWDGINGKHPFNIVESARAALALPDLSADILRARDARNGAYEMRRGARVIELFDDATMKSDHMLDSSECASILNALAEELEQKNG